MRAFLALPLPEPTLRDAAALADRLRKGLQFGGPPVAWTAPATLHLTLKFLGTDVSERDEDVARLVAALRPVCAASPPIRLTWAMATALPELREPRVLIVEPEREARRDVARLATAVERALLPLGFPPERRAFRPHLTLGRIKSRKGTKIIVDTLRANGRFVPAPAVVERAILYRSVLAAQGATHAPLAEFPLLRAPPLADRPDDAASPDPVPSAPPPRP